MRIRPIVHGAASSFCTTAVNRLKSGPENIPEKIC
jgi:hypothetical protein